MSQSSTGMTDSTHDDNETCRSEDGEHIFHKKRPA